VSVNLTTKNFLLRLLVILAKWFLPVIFLIELLKILAAKFEIYWITNFGWLFISIAIYFSGKEFIPIERKFFNRLLKEKSEEKERN